MNVQPVDYKQYDSKWGSVQYNWSGGSGKTISSSGCGPTVGAMLVSTLADSSVTPVQACAWSQANGCRVDGGTTDAFFSSYLGSYGIDCQFLGKSSGAGASIHTDVKNYLDQGYYVIALMGEGHWTSGGHFVLVHGWDDKVRINDPAHSGSSYANGDPDTFMKEVKRYWIVDAREFNNSGGASGGAGSNGITPSSGTFENPANASTNALASGKANISFNLESGADIGSLNPYYAFVRVSIGGTEVTSFVDNITDTVIDLTFTRKFCLTGTDNTGSSFSLNLYDDTAIEIEYLLFTGGNHMLIQYGYAKNGMEAYSTLILNATATKYDLSFEGASLVLSIEGMITGGETSSEIAKTDSYNGDAYLGKPSNVVMKICADEGWEVANLKETESVYEPDGNYKTFRRTTETPDEFIQSMLDECVDVETGVQGFTFYFDEDNKVHFEPLPSIASASVSDGSMDTGYGVNEVLDEGGSFGVIVVPQSEPQVQAQTFSAPRMMSARVASPAPVDASPTQAGGAPSSKVYWLGDSRFNGMSSLMGPNDTLIAKDSQGYKWLMSDAIPTLERSLTNKAGESVVLGFGANDVYNVNKYIDAYKSLMAKYPNVNFVITGVTPVYDGGTSSLTNDMIVNFNEALAAAFPNNYLDTYSPMSGLVNASNTDGMGVHYTDPALKNMVYTAASQAAGNSANMGSAGTNGGRGNVSTSGNAVESGTPSNYGSTSAGVDFSNITVSRKYEFNSGRQDNTVLSFSPSFQGTCLGALMNDGAYTVDTISNEMLECSVDGSPIESLSDAKGFNIMGLSTATAEELRSKCAHMWNSYNMANITATLEVVGDPTLRVGEYIYITVYTKYGYPHHTSGTYFITQIEDNISGGLFTSTMTLTRVTNGNGMISVTESDLSDQGLTPGSTNQDGGTPGGTPQGTDASDIIGKDGEMCWPIEGKYYISSKFGPRIHPIKKTQSNHTGVDIPAAGGTNIHSAGDGVVKKAGWNDAYGNYIEVDHGDGVTTFYAHMNAASPYKAGDTIVSGQTIGHVGTTGWSTGNHLHYEVRINGTAVDPLGSYPEYSGKFTF